MQEHRRTQAIGEGLVREEPLSDEEKRRLQEEAREQQERRTKRVERARKSFTHGLLFSLILGGLLSPFTPFYIVLIAAIFLALFFCLADLIDLFTNS